MNRLSQKRTRQHRLGIETSKGSRTRHAKAPWHRPGSLLEVLEDRRLLSTLDIVAGALTYDGTASAGDLNFATAGMLTFGAGQPTINYSNVQTVNVTKPASPPVGTGTTITAAEGQALNNVVVATFTESDLGNVASDFTSSIDWGDTTAPSI